MLNRVSWPAVWRLAQGEASVAQAAADVQRHATLVRPDGKIKSIS